MSDLQRQFAKAKLSGLPFDPPMPAGYINEENEDDDYAENDDLRPLPEPSAEDDSSSASSASSASSTGTIRPSPSKHLFARPKGSTTGRRIFDLLRWTDFFSTELYIDTFSATARITHHIYLTPPSDKGPLFVTHHGAGSSGLSFAVCASEIRRLLPTAGILSFDARGHGESVILDIDHLEMPQNTRSNEPLNLSLEALSVDLENVVRLTQAKMGWQDLPGLVLVGHSLGGAVVTDVAKRGRLGNAVLGYAVLDVVEGSAIDALQSMQTYLSTRPKTFPSISTGIEWHIRTRTLRLPQSARVSVPSLLCPSPPPSQPPASSLTPSPAYPSTSSYGPLFPDPSTSQTPPPLPHLESWTWRTDLAATQPFWQDWFTGLSSKFLSARGGKLLLLAGTDRLDKELMIGQMQGKYQLQVFPDAGHFIHEDQPAKTALVLVDFWRRNDGGKLVLPPKMSAGGGAGVGVVMGGGMRPGSRPVAETETGAGTGKGTTMQRLPAGMEGREVRE